MTATEKVLRREWRARLNWFQSLAEIVRFQHGNDVPRVALSLTKQEANNMGFGRGLLLWLIGIPIPLIILLAIFMHH
ncbi:hypothetical protein V4R08_00315 [Nitrobacter sp. NHB1]|uniref:hypothetical protein n=1 Tax=Nitrobacter sp. NHB1 TaxID=3119830 RepID=UPI00300044C6